jgi:glycosyltransferase involved in cell wall biosynthesis
MKILWLSHLLPYPLTVGVSLRSYNLIREAARGHEVHLLALVQRATHATPQSVEEAAREMRRFCARVETFEIPADRSRARWAATAAGAFFRPLPYDVHWLRSAAFRRRVAELAARERFDLVHADTVGLVPYLDALPGVPFVLNHHNVESRMTLRRAGDEPSRWRRVYLRRDARKLAALERAACARAAANLVVSDLDGERLREVAGPVPVATVPNGVDVEYFRPGTPPAAPRGLVFAGGMGWYPNRRAVQFFLREVWPRLLADDPSRTVTIVGRDAPPELVEAARDPRVRAPGLVPDVRPYLDAAAIYVCPIREGGGTRLKILDSLAMAKALVATEFAVEGLGMVPEEHYLRAESPDEFVAQIGRLEADAALRDRLGRAGRALAERHFAWGVVRQRLDAAYRAAGAPSPPAHRR